MTGQLQMEYQALLQAAKEKLRGCQESQAFGDALQGLWTWLEEIQERLGTVDSTMGTKEQLEQRLETVQVTPEIATILCILILCISFYHKNVNSIIQACSDLNLSIDYCLFRHVVASVDTIGWF